MQFHLDNTIASVPKWALMTTISDEQRQLLFVVSNFVEKGNEEVLPTDTCTIPKASALELSSSSISNVDNDDDVTDPDFQIPNKNNTGTSLDEHSKEHKFSPNEEVILCCGEHRIFKATYDVVQEGGTVHGIGISPTSEFH